MKLDESMVQSVLHERYRLTKLLSGHRGNEQCAVYLAEDERGPCVVKAFRPEHLHVQDTRFLLRLIREVQAGMQIVHANVVRTLDCGLDRALLPGVTFPFIVMEYCPGGDVRQLLRRVGRLPESVCVEFGLSMVLGLIELHSQQFLHRDLKPANVLIGAAGIVKLADFGLVAFHAPATRSERGSYVGTRGYAPPEQARGRPCPESDTFAVGAVLFELASGLPAHPEGKWRSPTELERDLDAVGLSNGFVNVVARLAESEPSRRLDARSVFLILNDMRRKDAKYQLGRQVLQLAACADGTFTAAEIATAIGKQEATVSEVLERVGKYYGIITRENDSWRYDSTGTRQLLYEQMGESERVRLHGMLAGAIEHCSRASSTPIADVVDETCERLCLQFARAHAPHRALRYARGRMDRLARLNADPAAEEILSLLAEEEGGDVGGDREMVT